MQEITYKLIARSPLIVHQLGEQDWGLPATSLRGATRWQLRQRSMLTVGEGTDRTEQLLFGDVGGDVAVAAKLYFSPAKCLDPESIYQTVSVGINRRVGVAREELFTHSVVSPGAELVGKVRFEAGPRGVERCAALSAILEIPQLGRRATAGFGQCDVKLVDRTTTLVFISYSWEDTTHMSWVRDLAIRLTHHQLDVVLDQLSPEFDVAAPQDEINQWMTQCVDNSDKVLAVLTPRYRQKAEDNVGGVGYEYQRLLAEKSMVSERLGRYVGVLRKGERPESLPRYLESRPVIDLRTSLGESENFTSLLRELTSG